MSSITGAGATWAGAAAITKTSPSNHVEIWAGTNPNSGSQTVTVTLSTNNDTDIICGVDSFYGVNQSTPTANATGSSGSGGTAQVVVTSNTSDMTFALASHNGFFTAPTGCTTMTDWSSEPNKQQGQGTHCAGAATTTFSWSTSSNWSVAGLDVQAGGTQLWSGIIDPSRAIDWTKAGATISSRSTECNGGVAISPYTGTAQTINDAIASCPAGQVVALAKGTFNLSSGVVFANVSNVTLRGAGPDQTFLKFTNGNACGGWGGDVCVINGDPDCGGCGSPSNVANWTAGYSAGTSVITLSSLVTGSTPPQIGQLVFLDQTDDSNTDTGQIWICQTANVCTQQNGSQNGRPGRGQQQPVVVTAVSGSGPYSVTISPSLRMPNWSSSKSPQAWWSNSMPITGAGIESLSIDNTSTTVVGTMMAGIMVVNGYGNWVYNVRDINSPHEHVQFYQSAHNTVQNSYFYGSFNAASASYGVDNYNGADNLVVNDIFQHIAQPMITEGCVGCVFAYNHALDDWYINGDPQWQEPSSWGHSVGDSFILWESNVGIGLISDDIHGTRHFVTGFRNYWTGHDTAPGGSYVKTEQTTPIILEAYSRYFNVIGNVLGTPGLHTNYQVSPASTTDAGSIDTTNSTVYSIGYSGNEGTYLSPIPNDMVALSTTMRWGNYDTATGGVRWCGSSSDPDWTTTCNRTPEVPSSLSPYGNPRPSKGDTGAGQIGMPPAFYLASQPSWWTTLVGTTPPWPAIGPDVTGGPNGGGHANNIPAQVCYANEAIDTTYQTAYAVTGATWSAGTATLTLGSFAENFAVSDSITVSGISPSGYNGTFTVQSVDATNETISYVLANNPGTFSSAGLVNTTLRKTFTVTAANWSSGTATLTIGSLASHLVASDYITVAGINPSGYNGTFAISAVDTTNMNPSEWTISYPLASNPGTYSSGGSFTYPNILLFNANGCYSQ